MTTGAWEIRWISARLPPLRRAWTAMDDRRAPSLRVKDDDVYLLCDSTRINLKLRRRTNSLKLKRLIRRAADGLERWRTEFDEPFPIGEEVAARAAQLLDTGEMAAPLLDVTTADDAVALLSPALGAARIVAVQKRRDIYHEGACLIDDVRFVVGDTIYRSIGVDSASRPALSHFRGLLTCAQLGPPTNYAQFVNSLAPGRR